MKRKADDTIVTVDLTQEDPTTDPTVPTVQLRNCPICTYDLPITSFRKCCGNYSQTKECDHEYCKKCVKRYIEAEVNSKMYKEEINCPAGSKCNSKMKYYDIKLLATKKDFGRYETLLLRKSLQAIDGFNWCTNACCGSGQIHEGGLIEGDSIQWPIMTCDACKSKTCVHHKVPYHLGLTCSQYDKAKTGEVAANNHYFNRETKMCPKCSIRLEKAGGCDHFTCAHCAHEFCWRCMADFGPIRDRGNHKHATTCTFYAAYESDTDSDDDDDDDNNDDDDSSSSSSEDEASGSDAEVNAV